MRNQKFEIVKAVFWCVVAFAAIATLVLCVVNEIKHPCIEWKETGETCTVCTHQSSTGACLSSRTGPCKVCARRK